MKLKVLYFAAVAELVGAREETIEVDGSPTVGALRGLLEGRHEALAGRLDQVRFAVNETFSRDADTLADSDVVAVIPPVAGGSDRVPAVERVAVVDGPLSLDGVSGLVRRPAAGAIAIFVGVVRDHSEGRAVTALDYSAYESMARAEMVRIIEELEAEAPEVRLAAHHSVGALSVGDDAVICAASAPHRGEAFDLGRALIDRIKERAPIWKRERGEDGEAWVGWEPQGA